jgi:hypothetical protein
MTVVNPKSISGINSITTGSGSDDLLTIHTNNGTERLRVDSTGATKIVTGIVTTLTATTGIVTSLEATTGDITTLRAPTGIVTSLEATTGSITTLRAPTGIVTTFVTNTAKVGAAVTITESGIEASGIGITCANLNGGQFGRRNKVINGAMQIAQRSTSVASITSGNYYVCDRWRLGYGTAGTWTLSQSTDTPDNFGKSLKMDCTAANTSLSAGSNLQLIQYFEGQDLQDVAKGTSSAKEITVSFYVKTNKTGTYVVELMDHDNSNRHCSKSYTVSDTNWNRYTLTFPADTTGTLDDDNAKSFEIGFWLVAGGTFQGSSLRQTWGTLSQGSRAVGQVNLADSTSNEWYLTGVQLEVGSQATAFEHRSYNEELSLCHRYFQSTATQGYYLGTDTGSAEMGTECGNVFGNNGDDNASGLVWFGGIMRTAPTVTLYKRNSTTTGEIEQNGAGRTAAAAAISAKGCEYINITGGNATAAVPACCAYTCSAEL